MSDSACTEEAAETLNRVASLCEECRFVAAYNAAIPLGPLRSWPDDGRCLAARLARQIGLRRLGSAILFRDYHRGAREPRLVFFSILAFAERKGPVFALELFDEHREVLSSDPDVWPEALAVSAWLHGEFRDFSNAHELMREALALRPEDSWIYVTRTAIHNAEDRFSAALEDARQAHALDPKSPSALHCLGSSLWLHGSDDEAATVLEAGLQCCESADLAFLLWAIEMGRERFDAAERALDLAASLAPLVDPPLARRFAMCRCDLQRKRGNREEARRWAESAAREPFFARLASRLAAESSDPRRVMLPVGFIRQHHRTCGPATLAAISRFWGRPAEHLDIVEAICYDGTSHHSERRWATEAGWIAREFTVDWASARALLDAGFPFTLTNTYLGGAHLTAAIGYDSLCGTLFVRDPMEPRHVEVDAENFCTEQAPYGPRGMVLAPPERTADIAAISLPDAELYDLHHQLQDALDRYRRDEAETFVAAIEALAPDHRLSKSARVALASYDRDDATCLAMTERVLESYPEEANLHLWKARALRALAPRERVVEYLRARADSRGADPLVQLRLVSTLIEDARELPAAERRLRRILPALRNCGEAIHTLAAVKWMRGEREVALRYYRFASTSDEVNEDYARAYFRAARALRHEDDALCLLRNRVARLGNRCGQPVITLVDCLEELERKGEARCALEAALAGRPEDGDLLLSASQALASWAQLAEAAEKLDRARGKTRQAQWERAAGNLALLRGDLEEAVELWRAAVAGEPLDLETQGSLARILDAREGREAAVAHLRTLAERFPHHHGINALYVTWLDQAPLDERLAAVRQAAEVNPSDTWVRRELAIVLAHQERFAEALDELAAAARYDPEAVANYNALGDVMRRSGNLPAARSAFRDAIRRSVDSEFALRGLLSACTNVEERKDEIRFIESELVRQVTYGDGLLTLQELARATLEPEELLARLREAHAARPDLWHAWVALVRQLGQMDRLDEAVSLADQAISRFPLRPGAHFARAQVLHLRGDRAGERVALEEATRLAPAWADAVRALCHNLEAEGLYEKSHDALVRGLRHCPADAYLHGYLADVQWRLGHRDAAMLSLRAALKLEPGYPWAWQRLDEWSTQLGQSGLAEKLSEELTIQRPTEARCWLARARVAAEPAARMAAVERAVALESSNTEVRALQLDLLVEQHDLQGVRAVLARLPSGEHVPAELRLSEADCLAGVGRLVEAVAVVENILEREPQFLQGWQRLAYWRHELDDDPGSLAAARTLHSLATNSPYALGILAETLRRLDPGADIRPQLRRALSLQPDYGYAAFTLFDELVRQLEFEEAEGVLTILRRHHPGPHTAAREVSYACRRGDRTLAEEAWRGVCRLPQVEKWLIDHVAEEYGAAGWRRQFRDAFDEALFRTDSNPALGDLWVQWRFDRNLEPEDWQLARVFAAGAVGRSAAQAYLRTLGNTRPHAVRHAVKRHRASFASDPAIMGEAAAALAKDSRWDEIVGWFDDWHFRDDLPAWAFSSLSAAFDALGDERSGEDVARKALALPKDHSTGGHTVRVAYGAAAAGAWTKAKELLEGIQEESVTPYDRFLLRVTQALVVAADTDMGDTETRYRRARSCLARAKLFQPDLEKNPFFKRAYSRAAWRAARMHSRTLLGAAFDWIGLRPYG